MRVLTVTKNGVFSICELPKPQDILSNKYSNGISENSHTSVSSVFLKPEAVTHENFRLWYRMKRISILLIFVIMVVMPSCGNYDTLQAKPIQNENVTGSYINPPGKYPIVNEPVTFKVLVGNDSGIVEDLSTNDFTIWYEKLTNIHIEWTVIQTRTEERISLLIATGDLPDIIMGSGMIGTACIDYAKQGILMPLTDYIDEYGPNIKKMLATVPISANYSYAPDGNIYALSRVVDSLNESMPKRCWIYEPWLKKLGLEMPQTTEQFFNVLVAFRDLDPNGNGINDEVPLAGTDRAPNGEVECFILNSFLYYDRGNYGLELLSNGKIRFNLDSEEYKEGLRYLNRLVDEGLLSPASFTQDRKALKSLTEGGEVNQLGAVTAFYWGHFTNENGEKGRDKEFIAVPVLEGPKGVRYAYDRGTLINGQKFEITKNCAYPEAAIRWVDYFFDTDGMMEMGFSAVAGQENVSWKKADGTMLGIDGKPAKYEYIVAPDQRQNNHWFQIPSYYESADYINSWAATLPSSRKEVFGTEESMKKYKPYSALDKMVPFMFITEKYAQEYDDVKAALKEVVEKYRMGFILGEYDLDTDWEMYLDEIKKADAKRYVELTQIAYDARIKE